MENTIVIQLTNQKAIGLLRELEELSVISLIELLCWKTDTAKEQRVIDFIAATALAHGFTLITNNEKDFNNINGLKMVNPFKV